MNGDPGFCLAAWSDQFSSWVSVAVFRERARIEHLAGRVALLGCPVSIVSVASVDDEDAEEGGRCEAAAAVLCSCGSPEG